MYADFGGFEAPGTFPDRFVAPGDAKYHSAGRPADGMVRMVGIPILFLMINNVSESHTYSIMMFYAHII